MNNGRLGSAIIVSGPSGVGKSTICRQVREALPELGFSVSCTTRAPRPGEVDGVHYYFLSEEEFARRVAAGDFVETAQVFDHHYGTLKSEVLRQVESGQDVFLDIDTQGAAQFRAAAAQDPLLQKVCDFVLIAPPSMPELERRLRGRGTESAEQLALRLNGARSELEKWRLYDYIVVNDQIEQAVADLLSVIRAVRLKSSKLPEEWLQ